MRTAAEHRGYEIVETDWTTSVKVGFDKEEVRPVYVIPGLKERPSKPFLTTVEEAREYIDDELDGREAWAQESSETFTAQARAHGRSVAVTIPSSAVRRLGIEVGDELEVTVRKARRRTGYIQGDTVDHPGP